MEGREQRIRERAYAIWQSEGQPDGRDQAHWEQASQELPDDTAPSDSGDLFASMPQAGGESAGASPDLNDEAGQASLDPTADPVLGGALDGTDTPELPVAGSEAGASASPDLNDEAGQGSLDPTADPVLGGALDDTATPEVPAASSETGGGTPFADDTPAAEAVPASGENAPARPRKGRGAGTTRAPRTPRKKS